MEAPLATSDQTCLDCESSAKVRATCCGRPCCEDHEIVGICFLCKTQLSQQHNSWVPLRIVIMLVGWAAGLAPYLVTRELWTLVAIAPALGLAIVAEAKLHRGARRRLLARRAQTHGWVRPASMPVPGAGRATLMDGIEDNKAYRVLRALSRLGR